MKRYRKKKRPFSMKRFFLQAMSMALFLSQMNIVSEVYAKEAEKIHVKDRYGIFYGKDAQEEKKEAAQLDEEDEGNQSPLKKEEGFTLREPETIQKSSYSNIKEIEEKRTDTSKTYEINEGVYITDTYFEPIHKMENGKLVDIDDTLKKPSFSLFSTFGAKTQYRNEDGLIPITFDDSEITMLDGDVKISYPDMNMKFIKTKDNAILYNNVKENMDIQVSVRADKVFQEVKYRDAVADSEFVMKLTTEHEVKEEQGKLLIINEAGKTVAELGMPSMMDQENHFSLKPKMSIEKQEDDYLVRMSLDQEFMKDPATSYPISLKNTTKIKTELSDHQPMLMSADESNKDVVAFDSSYVRKNQPDIQSTYDHLFVGYDNGTASGVSGGIGETRTYIDWPKVDIGENQLVTDAKLILNKITSYNAEIPSIEVYQTFAGVSPNSVTWNNQPGMDQMKLISNFIGVPGAGDKELDITAIVKDIQNDQSGSVMLKSSSEGDTSRYPSVFMSESTEDPNARPRIRITHRDNYDVDPDLDINAFSIRFRYYTKSYSDFRGISMDGIAKPNGKVQLPLYQNKGDGTSVKISDFNVDTGTKFVAPVFVTVPREGVQQYEKEEANYTTLYFERSYFPKADAMYYFQAQPTKDALAGPKVDTHSFLFYKVKLGDNLKSISAHYGISIEDIKKYNNTTSEKVKEGDELFLLYPKELPVLSKDVYTPPTRTTELTAKFKYRGPACYGHCFEGDPINTTTGNFYHQTTDFSIKDYDEMEFKRTYNSIGDNASIFGDGFNSTFEQYISYDKNDNLIYFAGDGKVLTFKKQGQGYQDIEDFRIRTNGNNVSITNKTTEETMHFDAYGILERIETKKGFTTVLAYDDVGRLTSAKIGSKMITFAYEPGQMLVNTVTLPSGRTLKYEYSGHKLIKFTNAQGNSESYAYDGKGKLAYVVDMNGNKSAVNTYDNEGKVLSQTDANGNKTSFTYGGSNTNYITYPDNTKKTYRYNTDTYKVNQITDENGITRVFTYANEKMTSGTDGEGKKTTYDYNADGKLLKQVNPDGSYEQYTYDTRGNLLSKRDVNGKVESFTYDARNNVKSKRDSEGKTTTYDYDGSNRMIKETQENGTYKIYGYKANDNVVETITHSSGQMQRFSYDTMGNIKEEVSTSNDGSQPRTTRYTYDYANRVTSKSDALGRVERYEYDGKGNILKYTDKAGAVTTYTYDKNGNEIRSQKGTLTATKTYDKKNRLIQESDTLGNVTTYTYDNAGRKTAMKDNYGNVTSYAYDKAGNLLSTIDPKGNVESAKYDKGDRKTESTDTYGNTTKYHYDAGGNLIQTDLPNGTKETTAYQNGKPVTKTDAFGRTSTMKYDSRGRVYEEIDANGVRTNTEYDNYDRITAKTTDGARTSYTYDVYGNQITETDPYGKTTRKKYDQQDRLIEETDVNGNTIRHAYDVHDNEIQTIDQRGIITMKKTYNNLNQLIEEIDGAGHKTTYAYNAKGQAVSQDKEGIVTTYTYDAYNNPKEIYVAGTLMTRYEYDAYGRKVKEVTPNKSTAYTYDSHDRIVTEHDEIVGISTSKEYDRYSNVVKESDSEGKETTYSYDKHQRLINTIDAYGRSETKEYDNSGNVIRETSFHGETTTYAYDKHNREIKSISPLGIETTSTYDKTGRLMSTTVDGNVTTSFRYDALGRTIEEHDSFTNASSYTEYDAAGNTISTTDKLGNRTRYTYDGLNQKTAETDPRGHTKQYVYDASGNLIKEIDAQGNTKQTVYNRLGLKEKEIDERGFAVSYEYNEKLLPVKMTGKSGEVTHYTYNDKNQVSELKDANGFITSYEYDSYGRTIKEIDPNGNVKETAYDVLDNEIEIKEPLKTTKNIYDDKGQLIETTVNDKTTVINEYNDKNQLISTTDKGKNVTTYEYDRLGRKVKETLHDDVIEYKYDDMSQLIQQKENEDKVTVFTYDNAGREQTQTLNGKLMKQTAYDENGNTISVYEEGYTKKYTFDENNRIIEECYPKLEVEDKPIPYSLKEESEYVTVFTAEYDESGNPISIKDCYGNETKRSYDPNGNISSETNARGNATLYEYDTLGNLKKVQNAMDRIVSYRYDGNGNMTERKIGDLNATYAYDEANRRISEKNEYGYEEAYVYDEFDRLVTHIKPDGSEIGYSYDDNDRKLREGDRFFTYDERGNVTSVTQGDKKITYVYDKYNNIIETMDPNRNVTRYSWDIYGNKTAMQYPNREELHYTYNDFGKLETIHEGNDDIVTYQYDARGNVVERKQIQGVTTTYSYDELSRKKESRTEKNGTVISSLSYTFDENGNIATETIDGKMNTYEYDKMDELSRTYKFENDRFLTTDYAYDIYGNQVEKTTDEEANKSFRSYHYDENNKLDRIKTEEGITNIKYTDNGNMSDIYYGDGTKEHYEYDDFDQLTSIIKDNGDVYTFEYDPEGERIGYKKENEDPLDAKAWYNRLRDEDSDTEIHEVEEKKEESFEGFKEKLEEADIYKCTFDQESFETDWYQSDVKFVLDKTLENSEILNISEEGNQIYGEEGIRLYSQGESANTTYIEGLNNSVYAAISSTQFQEDKITKYSYDDFGDTENITSGFGYNGERKDDSGLIYLRARYYNPRIGRFIQIDSYKGDLDNAESQNRYIYTINNPYKYIDKDGNSISGKAMKSLADKAAKAAQKAVKDVLGVEPKGPTQIIIDAANNVWDDTKWPPRKMGVSESLQELASNDYIIDGKLSEGNIYNPNSPYYVGDENQPCPPSANKDKEEGFNFIKFVSSVVQTPIIHVEQTINNIGKATGEFLDWLQGNLDSVISGVATVALALGAVGLVLGAAGFLALSLGASTAVLLGSLAMTAGQIAAIAGGTAMAGVMLQLASGVTGIGYNLRPLSKQEAEARLGSAVGNFFKAGAGISMGILAYDLGSGVTAYVSANNSQANGNNGAVERINAKNLKYSNSAYHPDRGYQNSTQIIQEIIDSKAPNIDPRGSNGLWWKVEGSYNGVLGEYELLISPDKTTIWHFLFKKYK